MGNLHREMTYFKKKRKSGNESISVIVVKAIFCAYIHVSQVEYQ